METTSTPTESARRRFGARRILVPTDFSESAAQALAYAATLAVEYGSTIRLLHVVPVFEPELYGDVGGTPYYGDLRERVEAQAHQRLEAALGIAAQQRVQVEPALQYSLAVPAAILSEAASFGADLIILGTHGRRGVGHLLLGSVAEEVVRRAPVSVLTVRGQAPVEMQRTRRILIPTDFSDHAREAAEVARELAARYGATLDLLHVLEPLTTSSALSAGSQSFSDYRSEVQAHLQEERERLATGTDASLEARLEYGHPAHAITTVAAERGADLIVMATHGRSGLAHFFIGSVTERVVRTAPCPVLTVRTVSPPAENEPVPPLKQREQMTA